MIRHHLLKVRALLGGIWDSLHTQRASRQGCPSVGQNNAVAITTDCARGGCRELGPAKMRQAAADFLAEWLFPLEISKIRVLIEKHGSQEWIWHLHDKDITELYPQEKKYAIVLSPQFGFGMQVRNALRRAGFGEQELGVATLEEVYVALLEAAVEKCTEPDELAAGQHRK